MTKRFSAQTEATLREAGWYPGRKVHDLVASWKTSEMLLEFEMFVIAENILLEFGGLCVDVHGPGENWTCEPFEIDPTLAAYENDRFSDLSNIVNAKLYPLGEAVNGQYFWAVGENEHIYLAMDDVQLLGANIDEALENLIIGH